ncbi:MAG: hypothetical protein MUF42_04460 [Cytophagaceae bacterium]|jgi:hypothetical protein|nr:hypothetical protein [Cytophagaceae bacterium]
MNQPSQHEWNAVKPSSLKFREALHFTVEGDTVLCLKGAPCAKSKDGNFEIYIYGIIYNYSTLELLNGFSDSINEEFIRTIEGSFIIFIKKTEELTLITDKTNSIRAFYGSHNHTWQVSTQLQDLPLASSAINPDGIACYLANGAMLQGLTLYESFRFTMGGNIYTYTKQGLHSYSYWKFKFQYPSNYNTKDYLTKLKSLLVSRIQSKMPAIEKPVFSLSAGYDVRCIAGIMRASGELNPAESFSYSLPDNHHRMSDAFLATQIAEKLDLKHQTMPSYSGKFMELLFDNVHYGQCTTHFCEELEVWKKLEQTHQGSDLIVGEQVFGYFDVSLYSRESTQGLLSLMGSKGIEWLKNFLNESQYNQFAQSIDTQLDDIWNALQSYPDYHDKKDLLYFEQRIQHILLPWRAQIGFQTGFVHNPLLDGKLLDFVASMPPALRKSKNLFKTAVQELLPELKDVPYATVLGYSLNLQLEIRKHQKEILQYLQDHNSLLEDFIPKSAIIQMVMQQGTWKERIRKQSKRITIFLRKKYSMLDFVLSKIASPLESPKGHCTHPDQLVLRILMMHIQLRK